MDTSIHESYTNEKYTSNTFRINDVDTFWKNTRQYISNFLWLCLGSYLVDNKKRLLQNKYKLTIIEYCCNLLECNVETTKMIKSHANDNILNNIYSNNTTANDTKSISQMFDENYTKLKQMLNLPEPNKKLWWGHVYWQFLHSCSILNGHNSQLNTKFAALLINLDLCILCTRCIENYRKKNLLRNYCIPIFVTNDSATRIFELHNKVNLTKDNPCALYEIEQFLKLYNLTLVKTETITIDGVYSF